MHNIEIHTPASEHFPTDATGAYASCSCGWIGPTFSGVTIHGAAAKARTEGIRHTLAESA